jgi:D-alanyl-lipoteichoic acid acyltransferase DltB (MBOAT superfamily)
LQNLLLLIASYVFYASFDLRFVYVLSAVTVINFYAMLKVGNASSEQKRKLFFLLALAVNLLILAVFKFGNFFITQYNQTVSIFGVPSRLVDVNILLPIGISFYLFQSLSCLIDVYRGLIRPVSSLAEYALFISFFPILLAGPMERARHLLPQFRRKRSLSLIDLKVGAHLIIWGLFQKIFIGESCAVIAHNVLTHPVDHSGGEFLVGLYANTFHIFADISGYTDMARGVARCLGFNLFRNFLYPLFASNIVEFWRRWHITVTGWFRDYVYFPLVVARRGRSYVAIFALFGCIAIWHGPTINNLASGIYFGSAIVLFRFIRKVFPVFQPEQYKSFPRRIWRMISIVGTFHIVCVGWFIAMPVQVPGLLTHIGDTFDIRVFGETLLLLGQYVAPLLIIQVIQLRKRDELFIVKTGLVPRVLFYCTLILLMYGAGGGSVIRPFIYFRY